MGSRIFFVLRYFGIGTGTGSVTVFIGRGPKYDWPKIILIRIASTVDQDPRMAARMHVSIPSAKLDLEPHKHLPEKNSISYPHSSS